MDLVAAMTVVSLLALIISTTWGGIQYLKYKALEDLISYSAPVCFICQRGELGHDLMSRFHQDPSLDPSTLEHSYVPAYLVYLPEENLR